MSLNPLPVDLYESLLPKLVAVIELTQQTEGVVSTQAKRVLQATNDFKNSLAQAKDLAANLPGGELLIEEQDDVIQMLETLRDSRLAQLKEFRTRAVASAAISAAESKMEIDSMASTPFHET